MTFGPSSAILVRMSRDEDYELDYAGGGQVLWGRVAILGVALLLAFFLGRGCAGGVPEERVTELEGTVQDLQQDKTTLQQELEALSVDSGTDAEAPEGETPADPEGQSSSGTDDEAATPTTEDGTRIYTVQPRDNLRSIAQRMCGDGDQHELISEANGIDTDNVLQVGQELRIPAECSQGS